MRAITNQASPFYKRNPSAAKLDAFDDVLGKAYYVLLGKVLDNKTKVEDKFKAYMAYRKTYENFKLSLDAYSGADAPKGSTEPPGTFGLSEEHKKEILKWYGEKTKVFDEAFTPCFKNKKLPKDTST